MRLDVAFGAWGPVVPEDATWNNFLRSALLYSGRNTRCAQDTIALSMLRREELIIYQSDRPRLKGAPPPQRPDLRRGRPLRCLAHSQDSVEETQRRVIPSRWKAACSRKAKGQFVGAKVANTPLLVTA
jgi:hypothetical protein